MNERDPQQDLKAIRLLLKRTREDRARSIVGEGLLWFAATVGAVSLSALLVAVIVPQQTEWVYGIWLAGLTLSGIVGLGMLIFWWRHQPDHARMAREVQGSHPELRDDLVAALQFGEELSSKQNVRYSAEFAAEHLHRTSRKALALSNGKGSLVHLLPARDLRPAATAALAGWFVVAMVAWWQPAGVAMLFAKAQEHTTDEGVKRRPLVGEFDIHLTFPSYTRRPPEFQSFVSGHVEALAGTDVRLRTYALIPNVERFELILIDEQGTRTVPVTYESGQLTAKFLATKDGTYRFRAVMQNGEIIEDASERTIRLVADELPIVTLTAPEQREMEVSADDIIEISYFVVDDYGLESVSRTHTLGGEAEKRVALDHPELSGSPQQVEGEFSLDLSTFDLKPKDVLVVKIYANDNNTLTGPGVGQSAELIFRVASPEDRHLRLLDQQKEIVDQMISVLGDYLEDAVGERWVDRKEIYRQNVDDVDLDGAPAKVATHTKHNANVGEVVTAMKQVLEGMAQDPMTLPRNRIVFESLQISLERLKDSGDVVLGPLQGAPAVERRQLQLVANHAADMEDALEKGILRLDHLLLDQKQAMIKAAADEIRDLKERLKELLETYRETQDPELKEVIKREIQRLRQRMSELMQRMQSQLKQLPQDHVNMDAVEAQRMESDVSKMADAMQSIEELLENGDIDGALAALDQMGEGLDSLTSEMNESMGGESDSEFDKQMSELMDQATDLEALQKQVAEETSKAQQQALEETAEKMEKMAEETLRKIAEEVRTQRRMMAEFEKRELSANEREESQRARQRLDSLEKALEAGDVEQASELARRGTQDMSALEFSMQLSQRYLSKGSKARRDTERSLQDLEQMVPRGQRIRRELDNLMEQARQQMAEAGAEQMGSLQEQQSKATAQGKKLSERLTEAAEKYPSLEGQLRPPLDMAGKAMGEAGQSLEDGQTQRAIDHQRQAIDELGRLKQSMKEAMQQQREKGEQGRQTSYEKVAIPAQDANKGKDYRQEVMRNMREDRLENYADEIQRYYESLME